MPLVTLLIQAFKFLEPVKRPKETKRKTYQRTIKFSDQYLIILIKAHFEMFVSKDKVFSPIALLVFVEFVHDEQMLFHCQYFYLEMVST